MPSPEPPSESQIFWRGSALWSVGGLAFMVFMILQVPAENFPLPESLRGLSFLAELIGNRATVFIAGWAVWSVCGMAAMWRLAKIIRRNHQAA